MSQNNTDITPVAVAIDITDIRAHLAQLNRETARSHTSYVPTQNESLLQLARMKDMEKVLEGQMRLRALAEMDVSQVDPSIPAFARSAMMEINCSFHHMALPDGHDAFSLAEERNIQRPSRDKLGQFYTRLMDGVRGEERNRYQGALIRVQGRVDAGEFGKS